MPMEHRRQRILPLCIAAAVAGGVLSRGLTFIAAPNTQVEGSSRRAALQAGLVAAAAAGPLAVQEEASASPVRWSGTYRDPMHPGCLRRITKDKDTFLIVGTSSKDGSKDCKSNPKTVQRWELTGTVPFNPFGPEEMIIDFTPKGGPSAVTATLEKGGIRFPDGNKWTRIVKNDGANGLTRESAKQQIG
mmetsp:Transcript_17967/g.41936  ORF Transcript_17967/g.41936 Transcript_17967/m.41936 type:complete len:189 (+) Transcript_17967:89-655(+)|eukprot:CAMPEP_0178421814 /NCGR_PEP_ID=MMETSP0689_2-20121128/26845_1 /TAXON_ID=160604 /ORGANISM="Amphidinium massartii, Strain CS-259" /LENGTH=188 /DNA_ID=CAMNT_0020043345 /DNA_START=86 /DNA_END=652 /DNA_ORIENTATION=+